MKKALITGISGQDGSYLAEFLLSQGYEVHGLVRRVALEDPEIRLWRLQAILPQLHLHSGSLESYASILKIVSKVQPSECYHLAAQSYVPYSFEDEFTTINTNINGTMYVLAALRELQPDCRLFFAGSSEMFGQVVESPQSETTRFYPRSPYGISKVAGFELTRNSREAFGLFACTGILFNHESPRRGREFVTRKITSSAARIKRGSLDRLELGNLEARRDWGHAQDYVQAMWRILQQEKPDDFVISTGSTHSVLDFVRAAFEELDLDYQKYVHVNPAFFRPAETHVLCGNNSKIRTQIGWEPQTTFQQLVTGMIRSDLDRLDHPRR